MGEGLGWGCPLNLSRDTLGDRVRGAEGVTITDAEDAIALLGEPGVTDGVVQLSFRQVVTATVDLDHQPRP
ncbi:MAG: hypothetical protein JWP92_2431 [Caulobacter sp.]|nr:hypothetical protein [Caulobacter sp.]